MRLEPAARRTISAPRVHGKSASDTTGMRRGSWFSVAVCGFLDPEPRAMSIIRGMSPPRLSQCLFMAREPRHHRAHFRNYLKFVVVSMPSAAFDRMKAWFAELATRIWHRGGRAVGCFAFSRLP